MKKMIFLMVMLFSASPCLSFDFGEVQIHGFISQGYLKSDANDYLYADTEDGTFQFNEMGINFATNIMDDLHLGIQLLSRDMGEIGNNEVKLDWAYADYRFRNWLGLRIGKMKRRHGFYNQTRDIDAARTFILLPSSIYKEARRDVLTSLTGVGVYGLLPGGVSYEFQIGPTDIDEDGSIAKEYEVLAGRKVNDLDSEENNFATALEWETPLEGLRIGLNYQEVGYSADENSADAWHIVASMEYIFGNWVFISEYQQSDYEFNVSAFNRTEEDFYIGGGYRFNRWFELGGYYSLMFEDKDDRDGDSYKALGLPEELAYLKDLALSARFDINDYWIVKVEGHLMDGLYTVNYDADEPDDDWLLFAVKTTFSF